jgi:hypothetical protein
LLSPKQLASCAVDDRHRLGADDVGDDSYRKSGRRQLGGGAVGPRRSSGGIRIGPPTFTTPAATAAPCRRRRMGGQPLSADFRTPGRARGRA